jgi:hypothetical protein
VMGEPHWVQRFAQRRLPGAHLAVREPGTLAVGDPVTVEYRPGHGVTVADTTPRPSAEVAARLLDADGDPATGFTLRDAVHHWCLEQLPDAAGA